MFGKLFIYDTYDEDNRKQAEGRFDKSDGVTPLPCASSDELEAGLDRLLAKPAFFGRVLVQTHGGPGYVKFGKEDRLFWSYFGSAIKRKGYEALFPLYTKIYFDGCEVGAGDGGDDFLEAVGETLLRRGGGEALAFTNPGYGMSAWIPFIGGHTLHFGGSLKKFRFAPGGARIEDAPYVDPDPNGKINVGNKV